MLPCRTALLTWNGADTEFPHLICIVFHDLYGQRLWQMHILVPCLRLKPNWLSEVRMYCSSLFSRVLSSTLDRMLAKAIGL